MPLKVNLRHLHDDEVCLRGKLSVEELDLGVDDELVRPVKPLEYDLRVNLLEDAVLVEGSLRLPLDCECARCLKPFTQNLDLRGWALHLPLKGEDQVSLDGDFVDLTPFLREDMLLEFPQHPLCKTDCVGLTNQTQQSPIDDEGNNPPSPWGELDKLKL